MPRGMPPRWVKSPNTLASGVTTSGTRRVVWHSSSRNSTAAARSSLQFPPLGRDGRGVGDLPGGGRAPATSLGSYVISMARAASDVLAVQLLLKETGLERPMRVVPLFETLDDLNHAAP